MQFGTNLLNYMLQADSKKTYDEMHSNNIHQSVYAIVLSFYIFVVPFYVFVYNEC